MEYFPILIAAVLTKSKHVITDTELCTHFISLSAFCLGAPITGGTGTEAGDFSYTIYATSWNSAIISK